MTTRLTWPGTVAYWGVTLMLGIQAVRMIRRESFWAGDPVWTGACLLACVVLTGVLFAVAAITRLPLMGADRPLLTRIGWLAVIGLTAVTFLVALLRSSDTFGPLPTGPIVFVPFWIRRLEESYQEGVEEARQAARAEAQRAAEAGTQTPGRSA